MKPTDRIVEYYTTLEQSMNQDLITPFTYSDLSVYKHKVVADITRQTLQGLLEALQVELDAVFQASLFDWICDASDIASNFTIDNFPPNKEGIADKIQQILDTEEIRRIFCAIKSCSDKQAKSHDEEIAFTFFTYLITSLSVTIVSVMLTPFFIQNGTHIEPLKLLVKGQIGMHRPPFLFNIKPSEFIGMSHAEAVRFLKETIGNYLAGFIICVKFYYRLPITLWG